MNSVKWHLDGIDATPLACDKAERDAIAELKKSIPKWARITVRRKGLIDGGIDGLVTSNSERALVETSP